MAIGIPIPPRQVPELRPPWRYAGTVFAQSTLALKTGVAYVASTTRILWTRLVSSAKDLLPLRARARQRQRAQFNAFERHYDALVDVLCAAAREGVQSVREGDYKHARRWMTANYPCIAKHLRVHWELADSGADPFQAIFRYPCLEEAINGDTGIEDIMRSRAAIESYRAELETRTA